MPTIRNNDQAVDCFLRRESFKNRSGLLVGGVNSAGVYVVAYEDVPILAAKDSVVYTMSLHRKAYDRRDIFWGPVQWLVLPTWAFYVFINTGELPHIPVPGDIVRIKRDAGGWHRYVVDSISGDYVYYRTADTASGRHYMYANALTYKDYWYFEKSSNVTDIFV